MPEQEQPIQPSLSTLMNDLGRLLNEYLKPNDLCFALFIFQAGQGDDHRSNYISNTNREDMIATLKEFIARAEGRYVEDACPSCESRDRRRGSTKGCRNLWHNVESA